MRRPLWWRRLTSRVLPARRLRIIEGDSLPKKLPWRDVVLAREGEENWCVGMRCPCGCRSVIELLLIREAAPRWDLSTDAIGLPTLKPSVWRQTGCRSHFWVRGGHIDWCE